MMMMIEIQISQQQGEQGEKTQKGSRKFEGRDNRKKIMKSGDS